MSLKTKRAIVALALISLMWVLGDGVQHLFRAKEAKVNLVSMRATDPYLETMQDILHQQYGAVAVDLLVAAAQSIIIVLALKRTQLNKVDAHEPPPAAALSQEPGSRTLDSQRGSPQAAVGDRGC